VAYGRLFEPMGWVVSSSISTNDLKYEIELMTSETFGYVNKLVTIILAISIVLLAGGVALIHYISHRLLYIVDEVNWRLKKMSLGKVVPLLEMSRADELGEMVTSLDMLIKGYGTYSDFAKEVSKGNYDFEFIPLSDDDVTGNELLSMRDSLRKNRDESKLRNWSNDGQAKFSDLLRRNNNDIDKLCEVVITSFVEYMQASVGTIFIIGGEGSDQYLETKSTYAYDRIKFEKQRLEVGNGMLGQCVLEKETTYLENVPDSYMSIKSGLGDAPPKTVLMTPMILEGEVLGVMEIASFNKFEKHQIAFAEKLCEDVASVISTVQVNEKTKYLLEDSQMLSEQMRAQEEEMRQNMEEMATTQEDMERRFEEMQKKLDEKEEALAAALGTVKQEEA